VETINLVKLMVVEAVYHGIRELWPLCLVYGEKLPGRRMPTRINERLPDMLVPIPSIVNNNDLQAD